MPDSLWQSDMFVPWNLRGASSAFSDSRFFFFNEAVKSSCNAVKMEGKTVRFNFSMLVCCWLFCISDRYSFYTQDKLFCKRKLLRVCTLLQICEGKKTKKQCHIQQLLSAAWLHCWASIDFTSRVPWGKLVLLQCFLLSKFRKTMKKDLVFHAELG